MGGWGSFAIPGTHEGPTLLYFPSTNSAAHRPADRDVTRLHSLLDDDVWAFANCRVEASGHPVAEIDWFFYNTRTGCLMISEWKRFPKTVALAADTGSPWLLADGAEAPNPIEQVIKQQYAVREVVRKSILPSYFPASDEARVAVSVYSPQLIDATKSDRLRFGKLYGSLENLAKTIQTLSSTAPLLLNDDDGARLHLARALCALFRCSMSAEVEAKLRVPKVGARKSRTDVVKRVSEIHREMARLHLELAHLTLAAEGAAEAKPAVGPAHPKPAAAVATAKRTSAQPPTVVPKAESVKLSEHERMRAHLTRAFHNVNGSADAAKIALNNALIAVLRDPALHGKDGISLAAFGSAATPLVKAKHESLQKLVGMQLAKWCLLQAEQSGLKTMAAPGNPSNIRLG